MKTTTTLSKIGFILSMVTVGIFILYMILAIVAPEEESSLDVVIGLFFLVTFLTGISASVICIIDLFDRNSKKILSIIGLVVSIASLLLGFIMLILGTLAIALGL